MVGGLKLGRNNKVYIVDDDRDICDSMRMLLSTVGFDARAYPSASAFLEQVDHLDGGCVVADVRMAEMTGIELVVRLNQSPCALPVILMTGDVDISLVIEAMRAGAVDFLEKPFSPDQLIASVSLAMDQTDGEDVRRTKNEALLAWLNGLSVTEKEVLAGVVNGKSSKTIALELGASQKTVEFHRADLMGKMNVRSLPELLRMWFVTGRDAFPAAVQSSGEIGASPLPRGDCAAPAVGTDGPSSAI